MAPRPGSWTARSRPALASRTGPLLGFAVAAGLMLLGGHASAAAGDSQGAQIAATCASCHSPGGSNEGIPVIAGIEEQTIIEAMHVYKASETPSHVMHAVALSLTDEELASVAAYLATLGEAP